MEPLILSIPQMGEGLQEAQIIQFYKSPGDTVVCVVPLFLLVSVLVLVVVEAPTAGIVDEWLCKPGDDLAIGAPVARISPTDARTEGATAWQDPRNVDGYLLKSRPAWRGAVIGEPPPARSSSAPLIDGPGVEHRTTPATSMPASFSTNGVKNGIEAAP